MLLRRITKHVKDQNWFAVGVDFFIVVIGILLAFQITEWNAARKDAALENDYLHRIQEELSRDQERLEDRLSSWKQVVQSGEGALSYARTGEFHQGSAWDTVVAFYFAGDVGGWRTEQETFEELRNAGRISLISNAEIRTFLIRYATGVRSTSYIKRMVELDDSYYWRIRQETPYEIAQYIERECIEWAGGDNNMLKACSSPFDETELENILSDYAENEDLLKDLRAQTIFMAENIETGERFLEFFPYAIEVLSKKRDLPPIDRK